MELSWSGVVSDGKMGWSLAGRGARKVPGLRLVWGAVDFKWRFRVGVRPKRRVERRLERTEAMPTGTCRRGSTISRLARVSAMVVGAGFGMACQSDRTAAMLATLKAHVRVASSIYALLRCKLGSTAEHINCSLSIPPRKVLISGTSAAGLATNAAYGMRSTWKCGRAASHCSTTFNCCS